MTARGSYQQNPETLPVDEFDGQQITDYWETKELGWTPILPHGCDGWYVWAHDNPKAWEFAVLPSGVDKSTALSTMANSVGKEVRYNKVHGEGGKFGSGGGAYSNVSDGEMDTAMDAQGVGDSLSKDERGSLLAYQIGSHPVNGPLHRGEAPHPNQASVDNLDSAITKGVAPKNMIVYRGSRSAGETLPPKFQDKGFVSTSARKTVALDFASGHGGTLGGGNVVAIEVPKGSHIAWPGYVTDRNRMESEILLPRGGVFTNTGRKETNIPIYRISKGA